MDLKNYYVCYGSSILCVVLLQGADISQISALFILEFRGMEILICIGVGIYCVVVTVYWIRQYRKYKRGKTKHEEENNFKGERNNPRGK